MKFPAHNARLLSFAASLAIATTLAAPLSAQDSGETVPDTTTEPAIAEADVDPYIWLEEARSDEALGWVRAENERTTAALTTDPRYDKLKADALAIFDSVDRVPYVGFSKFGLVNFWQDKENPKGLLRRTTRESYKTDNPEWETVLDVDALAKADGKEWVYKGSSCMPPEGKMCMISLSDGGKDATELREFDMEKGEFIEDGFFLPESLGGASWIDKDTLLISRDFGEGTMTESLYPFTTRIWKRGQPLEDAKEIFRGEPTDVSAGVYHLRDATGTVHARIAYRGLSFHEQAYYVWHDDDWLKLDMPKMTAPYGIVDGQMLFSTDVDWTVGDQTFPADALVSADLEEWKANPNGAAKTLVWAPADRQTKRGGATTANSLYVGLLDNVRGQVLKFDFADGAWKSSKVDLPDNATVGIVASSNESDEVMFSVTDFLTPSTLYYSDGGAPEVLKTSPARFDAAGMSVEQHEAKSADGTMIPYFIVKPEGMEMDGTTPTLMRGYGGFQISQLPGYLGSAGKLWLENGGAYVMTNLRGGGEFGPEWHQTAIRENKQRTWDDFIAIGEDLIARKYTSADHLGISGGSQGGLLVGTAITQRPELFNAAIVAVPLFDMLRFHKIGRGASWTGEYGDPRIPEQRAWIEAYSPYQKLVKGVDFPAPFLWASTADDRTHPAHARKGAARLKELGQPYFYYEDMTGGHSGGVENEQRAKLSALQYIYLLKRLEGEANAEEE